MGAKILPNLPHPLPISFIISIMSKQNPSLRLAKRRLQVALREAFIKKNHFIIDILRRKTIEVQGSGQGGAPPPLYKSEK